MSDIAETAEEAIERLKRNDRTLKWIQILTNRYTDAELSKLVDCLIAHPNLVTRVDLPGDKLTDETGVKLARYVATSTTVQYLSSSYNYFGPATYARFVAALCVNTSLQRLFLYGNKAVNKIYIDAIFAKALRANPNRPASSEWWIYPYLQDFSRLRSLATQLGPPSMLSQLDACETWHETNKFRTS